MDYKPWQHFYAYYVSAEVCDLKSKESYTTEELHALYAKIDFNNATGRAYQEGFKRATSYVVIELTETLKDLETMQS